jgi:hypothetical protein
VSPGRLGILTDALTAIARLIMEARSDRDAEAIVHQLRALGPAQRADVDAVEADARRRLRQDEPTQASPLEKRTPIAPDFPGKTCEDCGYVGDLSVACPECSPHRVGGPLGEGD